MVVFDFSSLATLSAVDDLQKCLEEIKGDISILVNNVGNFQMTRFKDMSISQCLALINVNVNSQLFVSKLLLPRLSQHRSLVVNISSSQILRPNPFLNVYGATKTFN